MENPYLLIGLRLAVESPTNLRIFADMVRDIENLLGDAPPTALNVPGTFTVQLPPGANGFKIWQDVATIMSDVDDSSQGDLCWFAHLADRRGCEFAGN